MYIYIPQSVRKICAKVAIFLHVRVPVHAAMKNNKASEMKRNEIKIQAQECAHSR